MTDSIEDAIRRRVVGDTTREVSDLEFTEFEDQLIAEETGADLERAQVVRRQAGEEMFDGAFVRYWMDTQAGVAKIIGVFTAETLRGKGIASTLQSQEVEYMRQEGVRVVFTDVVSEGGFELADSTGFVPITDTRYETPDLTFDTERNRGFMVNLL